MFKSTTVRIAAFVGALGASAALVGAAANTTGAYFTDSQNGNVTASTGHLKVDKLSDYNLSFADLVPGEYQDRDIAYHTDSSTPEDIWLYFPAGTAYGAFTGAKGSVDGYPDGGLGRYGHFAVKNNAGNTLFSSYNLANADDGSSGCADANGHGSNSPATSVGDVSMGYCGVPHYMLLEQNVPSGTNAKFTMTFGVTGRWTAQNAPVANVPFEVVATQHGVRPDAANF